MASIFTKIIKGEIPCYKIAENEHCFAFLDINPVSKGHTLVIPKKEIDYLFDLDDVTLHALMDFAKPIAKAIDAVLAPIRTGIIVEGLLVPHAHAHLIPIYTESQNVSLQAPKIELDKNEMAEIAKKISEELKK